MGHGKLKIRAAAYPRKRKGEPMGMAFNFKVGDHVFWTDPVPMGEGNCSGKGKIVKINACEEFPIDDETIISLSMDDGGEVECLPHEIEKIKK